MRRPFQVVRGVWKILASYGKAIISFIFAFTGFIAALISLYKEFGASGNAISLIIYSSASFLIASIIGIITYNFITFIGRRKFKKLENALFSILNLNTNLRKSIGIINASENGNIEEYYESLSSLLDSYKVLMGHRTKTEIRVALKVISSGESLGQTTVYTFARDSQSAKEMIDRDIVIAEKGGEPLSSATDLTASFEGSGHFLCNDISRYSNFMAPEPQYRNLPKSWLWKFRKNWPLLYQSSLVVPIKGHAANSESEAVVGFLNFSSRSRDAFRDEDVPISKALADQLSLHLDEIVNRLAR